jgi:hypothetical protein
MFSVVRHIPTRRQRTLGQTGATAAAVRSEAVARARTEEELRILRAAGGRVGRPGEQHPVRSRAPDGRGERQAARGGPATKRQRQGSQVALAPRHTYRPGHPTPARRRATRSLPARRAEAPSAAGSAGEAEVRPWRKSTPAAAPMKSLTPAPALHAATYRRLRIIPPSRSSPGSAADPRRTHAAPRCGMRAAAEAPSRGSASAHRASGESGSRGRGSRATPCRPP